MSEQTNTLQAFIDASNTIFAEGLKRAETLPANTVQVWPGGATFTSIQAAIDSITDANPQMQYQVAVGSGTYNEKITMKAYVFVVGSGATNTFITSQGQGGAPVGIVTSSDNAGLSEVTLTATGGGWGTWPTGIKIGGTGNGKFHASGVTIIVTDSGNGGNNVRGITNNTGNYGAQIVLGKCIIKADGVEQSTLVGIEAFGANGFNLYIELTSINVAGGSQNYGVSTAAGAITTLADSKITANTWALYDSDNISTITANQCTINGPVSGGVIVNP